MSYLPKYIINLPSFYQFKTTRLAHVCIYLTTMGQIFKLSLGIV